MAPELLIFDCDGVLVDSEPLAARVLTEALVDLGLSYTVETTDAAFRGRSIPDIVSQIALELGHAPPQNFVTQLRERTRAAFEGQLQPVPGVIGLLQELSQAGVDLCVASSGTPEKINHSLRITELGSFFEDRIFSASQVERGKPAPDLFVFAASEMGHSLERSVVIEDSIPGVQGAVASGARVLGYAAETLVDAEAHGLALKKLGAEVFHRMSDAGAMLGVTP